MGSPVFLAKAEQGATEHHREHDGRIGPLANHRRNRRGRDQHQHQRAPELPQQQRQRRGAALFPERIVAIALEPFRGLGAAQPLRGSLQGSEHLLGWHTPVGLKRRQSLWLIRHPSLLPIASALTANPVPVAAAAASLTIPGGFSVLMSQPPPPRGSRAVRTPGQTRPATRRTGSDRRAPPPPAHREARPGWHREPSW